MAKVKMTGEAIASRRCGRCKDEKPATEEFFHRNKRGTGGLSSICKECRNAEKRDKRKTENRNSSPASGAYRLEEGILYVAIDFTGRQDLQEALLSTSKEEIRPLSHQVLWCIQKALAA